MAICKLCLKATIEDRIVASVRARVQGDTCYVGRLIVHPDLQNQGIGTLLMHQIEARFGGIGRYELFTGHRSERNLYLYHKLGYEECRREALSPKVTLIFLEKQGRGDGPAGPGAWIRDQIEGCLDKIEDREGVRILYACESGSRGWGFASRDSDYDVRFLYLRPREWYLSLDGERRRDVLELPLDGQLDISGWDLRKALNLLRRSNAPLREWLVSPIVYREAFPAAARMRELASAHYSLAACAYHYYGTAKRSYEGFVAGSDASLKRFFYVLRPLLAVRWIERGRGLVPMEFRTLVDGVVESARLRAEIQALVEVKRWGREADPARHVAPLRPFVEGELDRLQGKRFEESFDKDEVPTEPFDELFRDALAEVWR